MSKSRDDVKRWKIRYDALKARVKRMGGATLEEALELLEAAKKDAEGVPALNAKIAALDASPDLRVKAAEDARDEVREILAGVMRLIGDLHAKLNPDVERTDDACDLLPDLEAVCEMAASAPRLEAELTAVLRAAEYSDHSLRRVSAENNRLSARRSSDAARIRELETQISEAREHLRGDIHRAGVLAWAQQEVRGLSRLIVSRQRLSPHSSEDEKIARQIARRLNRFFPEFEARFNRLQGDGGAPVSFTVSGEVEGLSDQILRANKLSLDAAAYQLALSRALEEVAPAVREEVEARVIAAGEAPPEPVVEVEEGANEL